VIPFVIDDTAAAEADGHADLRSVGRDRSGGECQTECCDEELACE
jgi:hypothetical protein